MRISEYKYIKGTELRDGYYAIPGLHRTRASVTQFSKLVDLDIELTKPTAFLYVDGFTYSQSDHGLTPSTTGVRLPILKMGVSYIAHYWVQSFKGKEHLKHVNMVASTCATGIDALNQANVLLESGQVDEVIIIGGQRTTDDTIKLFRELGIGVTCGDGFVYMKLERGEGISDIQWKFTFQDNPFYFPKEVIDTLTPEYPVDFVKLHGTGTESNTVAESGLSMIAKPIIYKDKIGHTQGISALLETCITLDDTEVAGKILVTANGVGGYYGSFLLEK